MTENEIITLIINRNEDGISHLIKYYSPLIKYVIAPILQNKQDMEDCHNEVIMRIWDQIDRFDASRGSFKAYITAIARNCALNKLRSKKPIITEELTEYIPSSNPSPEEILIQKELYSKLTEALNKLSRTDKAIFYRKYYYLQSTEQIAAETALTSRAVEGRLYRIRKKLYKLLGGEIYG